MNTTQHAGHILEAWRYGDRPNFKTALNVALVACTAGRPTSPFESERQELLQSIVEHLRSCDIQGQLPEYSKGSVFALLYHLSCIEFQQEKSDPRTENLFSKTLKFGCKRAKCFTEVECSREAKPAIRNQDNT